MKLKMKNKWPVVLLAVISSVLFLSCVNILFYTLDEPRKLKVSSITSESALVTWAPVKKAGYYDVMWHMPDSDNWFYETVTTNCITIKDLWYSQEYIVQVAAFPPDRTSKTYAQSEYVTVSFKTLDDVPPQGELARPGDLKAEFNSAHDAIIVSWGAVQGAVYYDICIEGSYGNTPKPEFRLVKTIPASQTKYSYTGPFGGMDISFKIAARNSDLSDTCRWSREVAAY